jgi:uncharacterized coiled-coil DUF342 family protein
MTDLTKQREAIAELVAQGAKVTFRAVQKISGGSSANLQMAMDEFNGKKPVVVARPATAVDVPEKIRQAITEMCVQIWNVADESANEKIRPEREEHGNHVAQLNDRLQSYEGIIGEITAEADASEVELEAARKEIDSLNQKVADLTMDLVVEKRLVEEARMTEDKLRAMMKAVQDA